VIPYIETEEDLQHQRKIRILMASSAVIGMVLLIAAVHFFWRPLDVLWFSAMRNIGM